MFTEENYRIVESATLRGNSFNTKQRDFIELMETKYVIAGPGAGKTTSLSAKIVLLLLHLAKNNLKEGICVITKTNVAVNEINRVLKNVGQSKMKHPHFIGTVHQFFNTYLATPYIKKMFKPRNIRFSQESEYIQLLGILMKRSSYFKRWSEGPFNIATQKISDSRLLFNSAENRFDLENTTNWAKFDQHYTHMLKVKLALKEMGCFSFDDIFLFSLAAINDERITSILKKRFKYIFIDEFQDNDKNSTELIKQVFNSDKNIVQFIGDPNQTLDFEGEMPVIDQSNVFELNICNRFGDEIGRQLPIIAQGVNIECLQSKTSFHPVLLIYKTKEKLIENYEGVFNKYLVHPHFSAEDKKDSILGTQHTTITDFITDTSSEILITEGKIKKTESVTRQIIKLINEIFIDKVPELSENKLKLADWLKDHEVYKQIKICLIRSIKN
jgi:DNA helicase-2/ATP-dependent DNA helicase PcrA